MKHVAAFSSAKEDWETPQAFFDVLNEAYRFTLDAAASPENAKCDRYYTKDDDALRRPWRGVVWCNPPYSHGIGQWVAKAWAEARLGATVVMLIPARTETAWWHDFVMKAEEIVLIRGRMRFSRSSINAPFPSALVTFRDDPGGWGPTFRTMKRILDECEVG